MLIRLLRKLKDKAIISIAFLAYLFISTIPSIAQPSARILLKPTPETLFQEGEQFRQKGDYDKSIAAYIKSLRLLTQKKNGDIELEAMIGLGLAYWNAGSLNESTDFYNRALALAKKLGKDERADYCSLCLEIYKHYQQGKELRSTGHYQEAIDSFNKAILSAREAKSLDHEVKCLRQLSVIYWEQSDLKDFFTLNSNAYPFR